MLRTIRSKILIVTLVMLTVFAIKVFYTVHFNQKVVEEMRAITQYQIPIEQYISSIDVLTYELELKVRRGVQIGQLTSSEIANQRRQRASCTATPCKQCASLVRNSSMGSLASVCSKSYQG